MKIIIAFVALTLIMLVILRKRINAKSRLRICLALLALLIFWGVQWRVDIRAACLLSGGDKVFDHQCYRMTLIPIPTALTSGARQ